MPSGIMSCLLCALYQLSYTAYRLFIHRPAPATQAATTAMSVSVTHKKFFYNPCHQTARAIMLCVRHTCRKWSFVASSPVGKTTQTSFSTRSSIISLSNAYPASGWVIFLCSKLSKNVLLPSVTGRSASRFSASFRPLPALPERKPHRTTARHRKSSISPVANIL